MEKHSHSFWLSLLVPWMLGAVSAFAMVQVLAVTAAIPAPPELFAWFKHHGMLRLALLGWDTLVVSGLSIALPAVAALLLLLRRFPRHRIAATLSLVTGVLLSIYFLVPIRFGETAASPFVLPWWQQGPAVSLLLASGIALGLSRRFAINARTENRTEKPPTASS